MFLDSGAWPPPPDGGEPEPMSPAMTPAEEHWLLALIGLALIAILIGPFAGSSVIAAIAAVF